MRVRDCSSRTLYIFDNYRIVLCTQIQLDIRPWMKRESPGKTWNEERTKEERSREHFVKSRSRRWYRYSCRRWSVSRGPCQWRSLWVPTPFCNGENLDISHASSEATRDISKYFKNLGKSQDCQLYNNFVRKDEPF